VILFNEIVQILQRPQLRAFVQSRRHLSQKTGPTNSLFSIGKAFRTYRQAAAYARAASARPRLCIVFLSQM
jgi:hypothetical protein